MRRIFSITALIGVALGGAAAAGVPLGIPSAEPAQDRQNGPAPAEETSAPATSASVSARVANLRSEIDGLIEGAGWSEDRWSVMAVSLERGDTLYAHNPGLALAPASNMKLFTTAAALYYLGPDFRYGTFLMTDAPIVNGVLDGDIVLYGTGDPTIADRFGTRRSVWQAFADTLRTLGVTRITGDVVGDASYFSGGGTPEGWQTSYMNASYAAPASALTYAENVATVQVAPAAQAGWRPEVTLVPGGQGIAVVIRCQPAAFRLRRLALTWSRA